MVRPSRPEPSAYDVWIGKLQAQKAAVNACRYSEMSLAECAEEIRRIGDTSYGWGLRGGPTLPEQDAMYARRLMAKARAFDDEDRQNRPELWEPGGPRTLPMVFGWGGDQHYARDLTPEESALRAQWKAKHDPDGPTIRERLTLEERINEAKHQRYSIALSFTSGDPNAPGRKEADEKRIAAWEANWAWLMEAKRQEDEENAPRTRNPAPGATQRPQGVPADQPAAAMPTGRPKPLRDSTEPQRQPAPRQQQIAGPDKLAGYRAESRPGAAAEDAEAEALLFEPGMD